MSPFRKDGGAGILDREMTVAAVRCHYSVYRLMIHFIKKTEGEMRGSIKANVPIQSINPLACTECGDSLPFSGASSIPPCHTLFPATPLCRPFFHSPSLHPAIYFLVCLLVLLFPDSYAIPFWESYFLPLSFFTLHLFLVFV